MKENIWEQMARRYSQVSTNLTGQSDAKNLDEFDVVDMAECSRNTNKVILNRIIDQRRWPSGTFTFLLLGLLGVFSGCFIFFAHPYDFLFQLKVLFTDGGEIFELWRAPPVDLYVRIYLFNVTNREAFLRGEEKLRVQEVGPYVYKELMEHTNVSFNDNGTVSAIPTHPLVWMPELSEGRQEDDLLILPNIALLSITHVLREATFLTRMPLNMLIKSTKTEPLVQMTAKEFMFGYESTLVTLGNKVLTNWISFDKLGLIDRMYHFKGDYETIFTGENNISKAGLVDTYRGSTRLPQWPQDEEHCSNVQGASDGSKFPGYIKKTDELLFFRKSLCRAAPLVFVNETTVNGLSAYEYHFKENILDNGAVETKNKCFCREGHCLKPGLLDVTDCYYGFPIALSYPHFYKGDPELIDAVNGSYPDKQRHETYVFIQPDSGLPLNLSVRFQINMALGEITHMANVKQFSNMVLPLLWFDINMPGLPEPLNDRFKLYLNVLPTVEQAAMYILFFGGFIFLLTVVYKILYSNRTAITQGRNISKPWLDSKTTCMSKTMENRLNDYLKVEKRNSMTSKELEVYFNGLVTPLNQELNDERDELETLKEEIV